MTTNKPNIFFRFRRQVKDIINLTDHIDTDKAATFIRNNVDFKGPNAYILAFAIVIASVGLNINSIPVIIGAMLISPLMGPIFGIGYGLGTNDGDFLKRSLKNLLIMVLISVFASTLFFLVSPLELENPTELLARTNPTIYDVLIALFGGFAGIVEITRKDKGTVISGVAIATALMPPLCTAGFGLASWQLSYFIGAIYLFFINSIFIALATFLTVKYLHFPITTFSDPQKSKRVRHFISAFIFIIIIPSVYSAIVMVKENNFAHNSKAFVKHNETINKSHIYNYNIDYGSKPIKLELMIAGESLSDSELDMLLRSAEQFGIDREQIIIKEPLANKDNGLAEKIVIQSIYERSDMEIKRRDTIIRNLEQELQSYKDKELPYNQIVKEIHAQYPDILSVSMTRGLSIDANTMETKEHISVILRSNDHISSENIRRMEQWLQVKLNFENITVTQAQ
ncbi:MAG: DUF389 domain-containing protein [Bacteroidales bacterium]|nr:DUF389 domain-containing protein [Bacteroidales bacterium]